MNECVVDFMLLNRIRLLFVSCMLRIIAFTGGKGIG